ncbi:MAG TPA: hypothetical protein VEZ41_11825 [Allosphingosinicella sp.]|nr:hypothetical protein [Allosphingosinicella sp.]
MSNQTLIKDLLAREEGAALDEMIAATGGLPTPPAQHSRVFVSRALPWTRTGSTV